MDVSATGRISELAANRVALDLKRELANVTTPRPHTAEPTVSGLLIKHCCANSENAKVGTVMIIERLLFIIFQTELYSKDLLTIGYNNKKTPTF